jgi:hypothetical protein
VLTLSLRLAFMMSFGFSLAGAIHGAREGYPSIESGRIGIVREKDSK